MAISIENEDTCRAVARLADLTGQSATDAIRQAVEEKLASLQNREQQVELILAIGRDCASRLPAILLTVRHGDLLFGDDGLDQPIGDYYLEVPQGLERCAPPAH